MIKNLFRIDADVSPRTGFLISVLGWMLLIGIWSMVTAFGWVNPYILPSPMKVAVSYGVLFNEKNLVYHIGYSIFVNFSGYLQALLIAIPLGFLVGLIPFFRNLIVRQIEAVRFTPLPATTGIFMALFGIGLNLKIQFLAFGIFVYLLPAIVQRIDEIKTDSHLQALQMTMKTLNASTWQSLRHFYFPSVLSRFFPDVINLVAVSWTYIVIAELLNAQGGLGYLIYLASNRSSHIEQVYAVIILIVLIGLLQDRLLKWLDRVFFKFKYA
ncbi:MAG: ABC transporter permease subunit [Azoarcus sp.]|jgi:NitT/TauT family transport system permease protein|nr:ABC transporter permease subunit [Azoarcus sp.]